MSAALPHTAIEIAVGDLVAFQPLPLEDGWRLRGGGPLGPDLPRIVLRIIDAAHTPTDVVVDGWTTDHEVETVHLYPDTPVHILRRNLEV